MTARGDIEEALGPEFIEKEDRMSERIIAQYLRLNGQFLAPALDDITEPYNMIFTQECRLIKHKAGLVFLKDGGI